MLKVLRYTQLDLVLATFHSVKPMLMPNYMLCYL